MLHGEKYHFRKVLKCKNIWGLHWYILFPNLPQVVATCYLLCLQQRHTLKVVLLAIETGTNFSNFYCLFEHVIVELVLVSMCLIGIQKKEEGIVRSIPSVSSF